MEFKKSLEIDNLDLYYEEDVWCSDSVEHWFHNRYEGEEFLNDFAYQLDKYVGYGKWDKVDGRGKNGWRVYLGDTLVGEFPINTRLDSFQNALNKDDKR